jgi:hypothetical protein
MVLFRANVRPRDLPIEIVELTAIHFHYAGFAGPILAYQAARWLRALPGRWDRLAAYAGLGVVLSMLLIAGGIAGSPLIEMEGSVIMALSLIAIAAGTTLIAWRLPLPARVLLMISSACVWIAMVLAIQYAVGHYLVTSSLSVRDMARTHGVLTAVFAVFGLGGWKLAGTKVRLGRRPEPALADPAPPEAAPAEGGSSEPAPAEPDVPEAASPEPAPAKDPDPVPASNREPERPPPPAGPVETG